MPRLDRARRLAPCFAPCFAIALAWLAPPATADECLATGQWYLDGGDPISPDTLMAGRP